MLLLLDTTKIEAFTKAYPFLPGLLFACLCVLLLLMVLAPRLASWKRGRFRPVLDTEQVQTMTANGDLLVVDLREPDTFRTGHIRGSLNVPFQDLPTRFQKPDPKSARGMVLVDDTDELSHRALGLLQERGYRGVYVLKGGLRAWKSAKRPLA
jgi:rhodanese-related sulfurtransferase